MKRILHSRKYRIRIKKELVVILFLLTSAFGFAQTVTPTKTVTVRPGVCGIIDVEVKIEGANPVSKPLEVVLVLDVSGSMNYGTNPKPLEHAKDAAIEFINKVFLPANNLAGKNKIALVKYNNRGTLVSALTPASGQADLITAINNLAANGSTNIQEGIEIASKELTDHGTFDCITSRSIVVLSDGVANRVGNDQSCSEGESGDCIQFAINAATNAKTTTISNVVYSNQIFSIGLLNAISGSEQDNGEFTLNQIQSGGSYFTENAADLTGIYAQIFKKLSWVAQQIVGTAFDKETVNSDFTIGTVTPSKGTAIVSGQDISWNIDFLNVETITLHYELMPNATICGAKTASTSRIEYTNSACSNTALDLITPSVTVPCPIVTLAAQTNVNCFDDATGSITINDATGGEAPYNYAWKKNGISFIGSQNISQLPAGIYIVVATDANGCTSTELSITIIQPKTALTCSVIQNKPVSSNGLINGEATVTPAGGTEGYSYLWDNAETTAAAKSLSAGLHSVKVTDANGCTTNCDVTIEQPDVFSCNIVQDSPVTCYGGSNGQATITAIGGNASYTYLWDNGETSAQAVSLNAGNHAVTVTDKLGYTSTCTVIIEEPKAALSATSIIVNNVDCVVCNHGRIDISVSGGTGPYTFLWSNGSTNEDISELENGKYSVEIKDRNGCIVNYDYVISQSTTPPITIIGYACNADSTPLNLSLLLPAGTPTNGTWIDTDNTRALTGNILLPLDLMNGNYTFKYTFTDGDFTRIIMLNMSVDDDCKVLGCSNIIIHNAISPNGDGRNDEFLIENIEDSNCYKNARVEIYNRWGVLVFEKDNYNNTFNAFKGYSEGRTTIDKKDGLPTGTYFYILCYNTVDGVGKTQNIKKEGYLYLSK